MTERPRLIHLTTTDISLELLLGPQLQRFVEEGYEVIGVSAPGPFVEAVEARGVRHVPLRHATRAMAPHHDLAAVGELYRLFRRLRPTIVHTHNPKPGLYGRIAAHLARVPVIVNTVHGLYALPEDRLAKRAVVYGLERVAATCSDAELVQNVEDIDVLRRLRIPESRIHLLGNGIDLERFRKRPDYAAARERLRAEWAIDPDAVVVGAVGRLVLEKGYVELLEAWRSVGANHPDAQLVIIGPEDTDKADAVPAALRAEAEGAGVRFLGHRHDVEDCYQALDIYVLATYREGFPRSAMEAAASGLPIVATDIRGCRQVVDDGRTGMLVTVRDATALAAAIDRLVSDPTLRADMSTAAVAKATADFDQERVIQLTLDTYERLLVQRGLPSVRR